MIFLSADDCRALLEPADVLDAVERALRMEHEGAVRWSTPPSLRVPGGPDRGRLRVKACTLQALRISGVRVLHFAAEGPETRWIALFREGSGEPLAIVDESWSYAHRSVASVALLAARLRPTEVRSVALVGAGRMARAALSYLGDLFPGAPLAIASRRAETRAALAADARQDHGLDARPSDAEVAVRGAQVILACTSAIRPVVLEPWVRPGAVVASLEPRELDPMLFSSVALRVVDSREQLGDELDDAFGADASGRLDATFAEVVAGAHPGRSRESDRVVVLSQGLVSQDVLLAYEAWRAASAAGAGTSLALGG